MRAGRLDRRITVQSLGPGRTPLGDVTDQWTALTGMPIWARRVPLSGREYQSATGDQRVAEDTVRYEIRYRADISADTRLRIVDGSRSYDIKHIAEIGRRQGLDIVGVAVAQSAVSS